MTLLRVRPQTLLLIDTAGAVTSAILLGVVLPIYAEAIGMPVPVLHFLAGIPVVFVVVNARSLLGPSSGLRTGLRVIAMANVGYAALSLGVLAIHARLLQPLGWAYFLGEIALVLALGHIEWHTAKEMTEAS